VADAEEARDRLGATGKKEGKAVDPLAVRVVEDESAAAVMVVSHCRKTQLWGWRCE